MTERRVWDVPTRVTHVALAVACAGAWVTGDEVARGDLHVFLGVAAVGLVGFRLAWGFVGGRWSRWSAFPWFRTAVADEPGHTRPAAWSAVGALALVGLLGVTGVVVLGGEQGEGVLAGAVGVGTGIGAHEVHEALAWAAVAWLAIHLAGVVKQSLAERQNLALGMVHGRKRSAFDDVPAKPAIGALIVGALALGAGVWFRGEEPAAAAIASPSPAWDRECSDCHLAYPPRLLPARSWAKVLAGQRDHFGEDLALDDATIAEARRLRAEQRGRGRGGPARVADRPRHPRRSRAAADHRAAVVEGNPRRARRVAVHERARAQQGPLQGLPRRRRRRRVPRPIHRRPTPRTEERPMRMTLMYVLASAALAATSPAVDGLLAQYRTAGAGPADAARGEALWKQTNPAPDGGKARSCAMCHGTSLASPGQHATTGELIEPMTAAGRLTDPAKIEKWLLRNCRWTLGRECTPQEKSDVLVFLGGAK